MINYISIREVMDDLLDDSLMLDITLERVINYAVLFIRKIGMPQVYTDKETTLELKNYRCMLPCDFVEMVLVVDNENHSYRYTTDTFHLTRHSTERADLTYKILNNILYSSKESGTIKISYRAIEVDCDGFPLLPNNGSFKEALELYIEKKHYKNLFAQGKINANVYNNTALEYAWAVGLALSDLIRPSLDLLESITNLWNLLITKTNEHNKLYINTGTKEYLKTH